MSTSESAHSLRRLPLRSPKRARKSDEKYIKNPQQSVHTKNFYVAAYPLVLVFNLLRAVLYHILLLLKTLFRAGSYFIPQHRSSFDQVSNSATESGVHITELETCHIGTPTRSRGRPGGYLQQIECLTTEEQEGLIKNIPTTSEMPPKIYQPGPGDPLLARQKHHHRKAFEYISKALKIDEENEG